ncbi:MAG: ABC transporter C-terminal domain-containing protein, partial [bacterium]
ILDYKGTYEEYVHFCGDDHLDVDRVVLKAKQTKKLKKKITKTSNRENVKHGGSEQEKEEKELWIQIDVIESRIKEIDHIFADPNYYERSNSQETADLSKEKTELEKQLEDFMSAWESMEKRKEIPE